MQHLIKRKMAAARAQLADLFRSASRDLDVTNQRIAEPETQNAKWESLGPPSYDSDALTVWNKNLGFMRDPRFLSAYARGMNSGHIIGRPHGSNLNIQIEWRIHVCCWAGWHAKQLPGDFVECGTNTGIMSLAVCEYVDFNTTGKSFYLFDTFEGIPASEMNEQERADNRLAENAMYFPCWEIAQKNFAPFPKAKLIKGIVPDTLSNVDIGDVAYLCIDMNIAKPERAALEHFWPKLVRGAVVIFDDYGWSGYHLQKETIDEFAASQGAEVLTLPTGQGLLLKPF
jgi:O-methyltransferase